MLQIGNEGFYYFGIPSFVMLCYCFANASNVCQLVLLQDALQFVA